MPAFRYETQGEVRYADGAALYRRLCRALGGDPAGAFRAASESPGARLALADAAREAFQLPDLPDAEALRVLSEWSAWSVKGG